MDYSFRLTRLKSHRDSETMINFGYVPNYIRVRQQTLFSSHCTNLWLIFFLLSIRVRNNEARPPQNTEPCGNIQINSPRDIFICWGNTRSGTCGSERGEMKRILRITGILLYTILLSLLCVHALYVRPSPSHVGMKNFLSWGAFISWENEQNNTFCADTILHQSFNVYVSPVNAFCWLCCFLSFPSIFCQEM